MKLRASWLLTFASLFLTLLTLDILCKLWVQKALSEPFVVFHTDFGIDFILQRAINRGGAFGLLSSFQIPLLCVRMGILGVILVYLVRYCKSYRTGIFLTILFTGAFGNVLDYFLYGYVVDMFHFLFWGNSYGIFNLADAFIFLGCLGMLLAKKTPIPQV